MAISRSNLYATCSAFSRLRRSKRSSRVSTRVGGGVSFGSYFVKCVNKKKNFCGLVKHSVHLPQRNLRNCRHPNNRESFFRVEACRREANMELDHVERIMPVDLVAGTASFFMNFCRTPNSNQHCGYRFLFYTSELVSGGLSFFN